MVCHIVVYSTYHWSRLSHVTFHTWASCHPLQWDTAQCEGNQANTANRWPVASLYSCDYLAAVLCTLGPGVPASPVKPAGPLSPCREDTSTVRYHILHLQLMRVVWFPQNVNFIRFPTYCDSAHCVSILIQHSHAHTVCTLKELSVAVIIPSCLHCKK